MARRIPKWLKLVLQGLVSLLLIAFVLRQIEFRQVADLLQRASETPGLWPAPVLALVLFNLSKIASALRLNVYQRHASIRLGEGENLRLYYAGMFLNAFLPGGIGGDGYKILVLYRRQMASIGTLLRITLADRFSGLLILMLLLCLLLPWLSVFPLRLDSGWLAVPSFSRGNAAALAGMGGALALAAFLLLHARWLRLWDKRLATVFVFGLAVQLLQLACFALLLSALQVPADHFPPYLAVFLLSSIAAVLPLSFGGLGAREVTFFYGLSLLSLPPAPGVVASTAFFLISLLSSLAGGVFVPRFLYSSGQPGEGSP